MTSRTPGAYEYDRWCPDSLASQPLSRRERRRRWRIRAAAAQSRSGIMRLPPRPRRLPTSLTLLRTVDDFSLMAFHRAVGDWLAQAGKEYCRLLLQRTYLPGARRSFWNRRTKRGMCAVSVGSAQLVRALTSISSQHVLIRERLRRAVALATHGDLDEALSHCSPDDPRHVSVMPAGTAMGWDCC